MPISAPFGESQVASQRCLSVEEQNKSARLLRLGGHIISIQPHLQLERGDANRKTL
jgi:hypothetical protein